jgi:sugar phosphate isomerase/epimerase
MLETLNRRSFLKSTALLPLCIAMQPLKSHAAGAQVLKTSLNAYSFNRMLNDNIKGRGVGITLIQVMEFAAKTKFEGFDATGYYFPGYPAVPSNAYIDSVKARAADVGIAISGTGVRNNFTTADKVVRAAGVTHIKEYVEVAARLGAPVVRVFADTQMRNQTWQSVSNGATRDDVQKWIAAALRECAEHGQKFDVKIGVQNHGDFLRSGEDLLALVKAVGSPYCGPIVDTGYFKTPDPYADMELVSPTAINWQVKQSPFGEDSAVPIDLIKMLKIVRKSGYSGFLPIETLSAKGQPYDPYTVVPSFLKQLQDAMAKTA